MKIKSRRLAGSFTPPNGAQLVPVAPAAFDPFQVSIPPGPRLVRPGELAAILSPAGEGGPAKPALERWMDESGQTPTYTAPPPWLSMPASGQAYRRDNSTVQLTVLNLPVLGAEVTVVTFVVPPGRNGVIQWVANSLNAPGFTDGLGDIIWRLEADGAAFQGFNNVLASASMQTPWNFTANPMRIFEGQTITLILANVNLVGGPGVGIVQGFLSGYFYPTSLEAQSVWQ